MDALTVAFTKEVFIQYFNNKNASLNPNTNEYAIKNKYFQNGRAIAPIPLNEFRAEAKKQSAIKEAEGKAEAIIAVQSAVAEGIKRINDAKPSEAYIKMKSLESFEKAADGKATKIIIPSEIQNMAGIISSLKEVADK